MRARKSIPIDSIEKGQKCMCIVDFNQIWFIDNKFGVSVRLSQALCEKSQKLPSFAFHGVNAPATEDTADDDEEEEEEEEECEVDE